MKGFQNFSLLSPPAPALLWERTALKMKQPVRLDALLWKRMKENGSLTPRSAGCIMSATWRSNVAGGTMPSQGLYKFMPSVWEHAYFQMLFSRSASANPAIAN